MEGKLKLGIIGAGGIFKFAHMKAWIEHPEVEIVAVSDSNEANAREIAKLTGARAVYSDYRKMLENEDIDIVDICTPNVFHSEVSVSALLAGKHVLCEKPDAVSPVEAQKMADAAASSGKVMMTMRNNRFTPSSQYLKRFADEGGLGEIYTGRCGWIRRRGIPGKGGWFTTKALSGGGPLIDLGVHFIDLAMWFMGNPKPVSVSAATYTKFANGEPNFDVEDLATGFIRFDNGSTLQIEFSWASNIEEEINFVELRGTKAGASLRMGELKLFSEDAGHLIDIQPVRARNGSVPMHDDNIYHFVDCVKGRTEPTITPEQGVDMIKILSAIYESAELGAEIRI